MAEISALQLKALTEVSVLDVDDIFEVTVSQESDVSALTELLEPLFPGLLDEVARSYLDEVLKTIPAGIVPAEKLVSDFVKSMKEVTADGDMVREAITQHFALEVNQSSPSWARFSIMAMTDYALGDLSGSLFCAGLVQCSLEMPELDIGPELEFTAEIRMSVERMERAKAAVFIPIFLRLRATR